MSKQKKLRFRKLLGKIKAVVFDRDGTLIKHVEYLNNPKEVELLPGVQEGLKFLKSKNIQLFLHTNQSGIGRGLYTLSDVHACNKRMEELLGLGNNIFERICIAGEKPGQTIYYRKPSPNFVIEISRHYNLDFSEIIHVGDRLSDICISLDVGSKAIGVNTGLVDLRNEVQQYKNGKFVVFDSFNEVINYMKTSFVI